MILATLVAVLETNKIHQQIFYLALDKSDYFYSPDQDLFNWYFYFRLYWLIWVCHH